MPTRLAARLTKPVGRNTARSLGSQKFIKVTFGTYELGYLGEVRDVGPFAHSAHLSPRHRPLVGRPHAFERLVRRAQSHQGAQLVGASGVAQGLGVKDRAKVVSR